MKALRVCLVFSFCLFLIGGLLRENALAISAKDVEKMKVATETDQIILVGGISQNDALLLMYEKIGGIWKETVSTHAYIGKNGLGKTREGDGKTPTGRYHFTEAFGILGDPGSNIKYTQVNENHYWVGDSNSPKYNKMVNINEYNSFNKKESEHLVDYAQGYRYCLNLSYNEEGTPKKGSAIFLHCDTEKGYTAGCIAVPESTMKEILTRVKSKCAIIIDSFEKLTSY